MPKKTILLWNDEGHGSHPRHRTLWSDTWVRFHQRRRPITLGPTFLSTVELARDVERWDAEPELPGGDWAFCLPYGDDDRIPDIGVNSPWVDRALLEAATAWYLRRRYGITERLRFRWKGDPVKFYFTPS